MKAELEMAYQKHKQALLAVALNVTRCQELAEDAIQTAFSKLAQQEYQPEKLKPYLFKTVRNSAVDIIRKRQRESEKVELFGQNSVVTSAEQEVPANGHIDELVRQETVMTIRGVIENLPTEDREIILLKTISGLTFDEVAEIVQKPASSIATRYRRLLQKLKEQLKGRV